MTAAGDPAGYQVSYSARVRDRLAPLAAVARSGGQGEAFLAALKEFDRRLQVYPQFGDPLFDLSSGAGQVRLGMVPPLVMRYGVVESQRLVIVGAPPGLLPRRSAE